MYSLDVKPELDKIFKKLMKRDWKRYEIVMKKAEEIIENPQHYKNLKAPLNHLKEVHIDSHFVLTFSVDEKFKIVTLIDFYHHEKIFKK